MREMVPLRDLGQWSGGNTPSKAREDYWSNGTVPWVSPKDMKTPEITSSEDRISEVAMNEGRAALLPPGAVLVVTRSGILSHTLPVATTRIPVTINQDIKALVPRTGVLPNYVAYALKGAGQRILKNCSKHGTTVASIETNALLDFEIPLVDVDEQRRIVAEIDKQFSRLDEAVANLQRVKANLKRYKAAVLKAAVEGRLVETNGGWSSVVLGDVALSVRNGCSVKPDAESGTRILRISAVRPLELDADDVRFLPGAMKDYAPFDVQAGDVLFTRYNGSRDYVGVCAVVPRRMASTIYPDKLIRVRVDKEKVLPAFLAIACSAGQGRDFIKSKIRTTAGQSGVSGSDIKSIPMRVPSVDEQMVIVAEADRRLSVLRNVEAEVNANLQRAHALRQSVLAKSFQ